MISDITRQPGKFLTETRDGVTEEGALLSRRLPPGSLILSNSGTVCVPKILQAEGCIHDGFVSFTGFGLELSHEYLYWWFERVRPEIVQENRQGITQVNLNTEIVREIHLPLAPRPEQTRVAELIDELMSDLDAGVAALERARKKLELYRASVLKAAVEGKLTAEWRKRNPDAEPASTLLKRVLAERRRHWESEQLRKFQEKGQKPPKNWQAKYKGPAAPDTATLPLLPEGWCWVTLDQLGEIGTGATPNRGLHERYFKDGSIPWVTSSCVNAPVVSSPSEYVTHAALAECNLTVYPPHTLLLAMYGEGKTRGMCSELLIECSTNQALAAIQTAPEVRGYVKLFLWGNYEESRRPASGGVQPNLNLGLVRAIRVPLPPSAEQEMILVESHQQLSVIDHLALDLESKLSAAQALHQAILRHAFSGKLAPQDPNDESATELLRRIAVQRAAHARGAAPPKRTRRKKDKGK